MVAMKKTTLCMTEVLQEYESLRGAQGESVSSADGNHFWDIVVLTTSDYTQQQVYELEIADKLERKELPLCAKYHVIHDPPGPKIGAGGSTMYTLSKLVKLEPNWRNQKVLLMHAGGSSQRLPSASVLGKAFITVPIGNKVYTMFDVKLALCLPFAKRVPPGVFICCPDTFECFTFGNNGDWNFGDREGFLAMAHPSPLSVGKGHGVYILEDRNSKLDTEVLNCKKVLQKPTEKMMREEKALLCPSEVPDSIRAREPTVQDWVFTDSQYFFDHTISDKLLAFYEQHKPLTAEICAYGDFLQPLGKCADGSYVTNCKNIMRMTSTVISTRTDLYEMLKGSPLNVIALKYSKFYHIGTMIEYIDSFCSNDELKEELGLSKFCFSVCLASHSKQAANVRGCVIHSIITDSCSFSDRAVVEYCTFTTPHGITIQENCVVSDCEYKGDVPLAIPCNTFIQTIPVLDPSGAPKYVTLLFSIHDDMKAKVSSVEEVQNLSYFGHGLLSVSTLKDPAQLFGNDNPFSLWHAKLFPLSSCPEESFTAALHTLKTVLSHAKRPLDLSACSETVLNGSGNVSNGTYDHTPHSNGSSKHSPQANGTSEMAANSDLSQPVLYSFADVIVYKDAKRMILRRNELSKRIKDASATSSP